MPGLKTFLQKHSVPLHNNYECVYEQTTGNDPFLETKNGARSNNDADQRNLIKNDADPVKNSDQLQISTIKECLRNSLLSVASKLLSSEHLTLEHLSSDEQHLWNSYNNANIYEFLTGEKDTIPEFQFDWITPQPTLR
jgi:hypothetical protein